MVNSPVYVFHRLISLKKVNLKLQSMSHSFQNKLQDDAESSDTSINKAALTLASYTRIIYYKYNRIPVFYHLAFAFMETKSKMGLFQHFVCISSINCIFLFICLYIFGDLFEILLPLFSSITILNSYYIYFVWEDIENVLNRIADFLINLWNSFQSFFLNFINVLGMFF